MNRVDFFISYAQPDEDWAQWVAWQLQASGYSVVIQCWDFDAGANFAQEMQTAASAAERTVAILSPDFLQSQFTQPEWQAAFSRDPTGDKRLLVPVLVRPCKPEGLLGQIVWIDLTSDDQPTARERLLREIAGKKPPDSEPKFPGRKVPPSEPAFPGRSSPPQTPSTVPTQPVPASRPVMTSTATDNSYVVFFRLADLQSDRLKKNERVAGAVKVLEQQVEKCLNAVPGAWHRSSVTGRFAVVPGDVELALRVAADVVNGAAVDGVELNAGVAFGRVEERGDVDATNWAGRSVNVAARLAAVPEKLPQMQRQPTRHVLVNEDVLQDAQSASDCQFGEMFDPPCTQALYKAVTGDQPSRFKSENRPVEQVSWNDCQTFMKKLEELVPGMTVSLPTEAEWEYACRAGTTEATYAGLIEIISNSNAPILHDIAWYSGNCGVEFDLDDGWDFSGWSGKQFEFAKGGTREVGMKQANPWGLRDMLGNVFEWCQDFWNENAGERGGCSDPCEQSDSESANRVIRGGSWASDSRYVRAAYRDWREPGDRGSVLGFRCRVR